MTAPTVLYKYTSGDTAKIVLQNGQLRWSSPELFNDPAEFRRLPVFRPSLVEAMADLPKTIVAIATGKAQIDEARLSPSTRVLLELVRVGLSNALTPEGFLESAGVDKRQLDEMHHHALREFLGPVFTKSARVLCLSANPLNPALWANYANTHTGCLLGFRHLPTEDTPLQKAKKVTYSEVAPSVGSGLDFLLYGATPEMRAASLDAVCYTKKIEWQYEEEWRVMTWRPDSDVLYQDFKFFPEELESVTLGLRASEDLISEITEVVRTRYPASVLYRIQETDGELRREPLG